MGKLIAHIENEPTNQQLDESPHHGRDDSIVSKPPLLVETSNDGPKAKSPVFRLPTELTMHIFQQCQSDILPRLSLTHTFRRWRHIAVNDASLWTSILILTRDGRRKASLNGFLSFLGMQLDRTANHLLDVIWYTQLGGEFFVGTLRLIRQKAPFSRWRTLTVYIAGGSQEDAPWSSVDTFTNLESLSVVNRTEDNIISAIDRMITSRLNVLELVGWSNQKLHNAMTSLARSMTYISTLLVSSLHWIGDTPFPFANVVNLSQLSGDYHRFPHIETYNMLYCEFKYKGVDLRSMTTLTVRHMLTVWNDCHVLLPALRELKVGLLCFDSSAKFEAPSLDTLHFRNVCGPGVMDDRVLSCTQDPAYVLSPNTSIIADSYVTTRNLITLLAKSPKVTHAALRFPNWADARAVLERLAGFKTGTNSHPVVNGDLCPRLSELRMDFDWEFSEPSESKEWLLDALKSRKYAGIVLPLSIYVGWKGEGTYVLLTGDGCEVPGGFWQIRTLVEAKPANVDLYSRAGDLAPS